MRAARINFSLSEVITKGINRGDLGFLMKILKENPKVCKCSDFYPLHDLAEVSWEDFEHNVIEIADIFLRGGVDINAKNEHNETALCSAAIHNKPDLARFLIRCGADRENGDGDIPSKYNPLICALDSGSLTIANMLINEGVNVNATSPVSAKSNKLYKKYIDDPRLKNSVLYFAATLNEQSGTDMYDICEKLLEGGAKPNETCYILDCDGNVTSTRVLNLIYKLASERGFTQYDEKLLRLFSRFGARSTSDGERFGYKSFESRHNIPVGGDFSYLTSD